MSADPSATGDRVDFTTRGSIHVPQLDHMMLERADWRRIRRNVGRLAEPLTDQAATWSATAVGVFFASLIGGIALIASHAATAFWIAFLVLALCALPFAICFHVIGQTEQRRHGTSVASVCEDMDDIGDRAGEPWPDAPQVSTRRTGGALGWLWAAFGAKSDLRDQAPSSADSRPGEPS